MVDCDPDVSEIPCSIYTRLNNLFTRLGFPFMPKCYFTQHSLTLWWYFICIINTDFLEYGLQNAVLWMRFQGPLMIHTTKLYPTQDAITFHVFVRVIRLLDPARRTNDLRIASCDELGIHQDEGGFEAGINIGRPVDFRSKASLRYKSRIILAHFNSGLEHIWYQTLNISKTNLSHPCYSFSFFRLVVTQISLSLVCSYIRFHRSKWVESRMATGFWSKGSINRSSRHPPSLNSLEIKSFVNPVNKTIGKF